MLPPLSPGLSGRHFAGHKGMVAAIPVESIEFVEQSVRLTGSRDFAIAIKIRFTKFRATAGDTAPSALAACTSMPWFLKASTNASRLMVLMNSPRQVCFSTYAPVENSG